MAGDTLLADDILLQDVEQSGLTPTAGLAGRSNAFTNKLTSVLSVSYADSDTRDALEILDGKHVSNTAETRRRLRLDAQKEVIDCNGAVVRDFGKVADVSSARKESVPMLEEAATFTAQNETVKAKQDILESFKNRFVMDLSDVHSLTSPTEPVDDRFFELLGQSKRIFKDCEILLGTENHKLGLELMDQTSRNLNNAYKKLYNWIQKEFKILDLEDPHVGGPIRRALRVLAERPSLFQNCLDLFAEAREHTLSDAFHAALTNVADGVNTRKGSAKPIEFSTHDLLRYVGDMLAWVHSAAVSEQESLEGLFIAEGQELAKGLKVGKESEVWANDEGNVDGSRDEVFDGRKALNDLVNRNLAGVSRTLKQRVELAIRNHDDSVVVWKTKNLLDFYEGIFSKLVGDDTTLVSTTTGLIALTFDHFEQLLADEASQATHESVPNDFSIPHFLLNALERVIAILKTESATVSTSSKSAMEPTSRLLASSLTPFLDQCSELTVSLPDADPASPPIKAIFQLNCLTPVLSQLAPYSDIVKDITTSVSKIISDLTTTLTIAQHHFFLRSSGVDTLLSAIESSPPDQPITTLPAFEPGSLSVSAQKLDDFLPEAVLEGMENLKYLTDKKLAKQVNEEAGERFCADFEVVENKLTEADEMIAPAIADDDDDQEQQGEEEKASLREVYPRTLGEVRVLLS
ncbi:MAG: hypothetical protein Q9160_000838 [Pyrenula sp. 1 TL-2023]